MKEGANMNIAVFSDSHRNTKHMITAIEDYKPDCIIHLGDVAPDADFISRMYPAIPMYSVRGNCDFGATAPESLLIELGGVRMFLAHGHLHGVKMSLDSFLNSTCCSGSALGLFGHTHRATCRSFGNVQLFNPGSCAAGPDPTYGQITIENGTAFCKIVKIR